MSCPPLWALRGQLQPQQQVKVDGPHAGFLRGPAVDRLAQECDYGPLVLLGHLHCVDGAVTSDDIPQQPQECVAEMR